MSESAPSPMARTLSFARRPLSKEEEAELYAAAPDEVLSPGSAQVLRTALQAEADETIVASSLVCPITNELMTDPVFTMDGQTYERAAIEAWLRNHDTSPATGKPLPSKMLVTSASPPRSPPRPRSRSRSPSRSRSRSRSRSPSTSPSPSPSASPEA